MKNNKNKSEHKEKRSLDDQSLSKASGGISNIISQDYGNVSPLVYVAYGNFRPQAIDPKAFNQKNAARLAYGNFSPKIPRFDAYNKETDSSSE